MPTISYKGTYPNTTKCGTFSSFPWLSPDIYHINIKNYWGTRTRWIGPYPLGHKCKAEIEVFMNQKYLFNVGDAIIDVFAELFRTKCLFQWILLRVLAIFFTYFWIKKTLIARWRNQWRFAELFRTKCLRPVKIIAIFSDFCFFEIKP